MILIWFIFIKLLYLYKDMKSIIGDKLLYDWSKLLDLQPDGLKVPINIDALKKSLLKNNFAFPFFGYKDEEGVWIIDGHTRKQVLYELLQDGEDVPELLEVQLINCESKDKAREILLEVFNQKHNPMNEEVLIEYIEQYQLDVDVIPLNVFVEKIEDVEHEKTEDNYTGNFPLAIILLKKDYEKWQGFKRSYQLRSDTDAFLKLLDEQLIQAK